MFFESTFAYLLLATLSTSVLVWVWGMWKVHKHIQSRRRLKDAVDRSVAAKIEEIQRRRTVQETRDFDRRQIRIHH